MGARFGQLIAISIAACTGCADEVFELDPPQLEDAKAVIFVFELSSPRAFAVDPLDQTQTVALKFDGGEVPVYALLYEKTLAELELQAGELGLVEEGRPLPDTPRPIQRAIGGSGVGQPWTDVPLPQFIRELRIVGDAPDPCVSAPRFMLETHELETKTNGREIIALGDGTALITGTDDTFYRMGPNLFERTQPVPGVPSGAIYRAPDGALWFAGKDGALLETRNGAVTRTLAVPTGGDIYRLAGPSDSTVPFELLILDFKTAALFRLDAAGAFVELTRAPGIIIGDVAWTAEREGFAVLGSRNMLTVIEDDTTRPEDLGIGNFGVASLTVHPTYGLFVGTVNGRVVRKIDGVWTDLGDLGSNVETLAPYGEGVVLGGYNGFFGYWSESTGLCAEQFLPGSAEKVLPIGDDIAVTMLNENWLDPESSTQPTYATWLRRLR